MPFRESETEKLARRFNHLVFGSGDSFTETYVRVYLIAMAALAIGGIVFLFATLHH